MATERILGLDVGIASIGWALVDFDAEDTDNCKIVAEGARIFPRAENPKDGASLALPRRQARTMRKRLQRKSGRMSRICDLFLKQGLLSSEEHQRFFDLCGSESAKVDPLSQCKRTPWFLRARALEEKLSGLDLSRALYHIANHRGFQSQRKSESKAKEGEMLKALSENVSQLESSGCKTYGEWVFNNIPQGKALRNKGGSYSHVIARSVLKTEIQTIFAMQRELGSAYADPGFEQAFLDIFEEQKAPLSGEQLKKMVGYCTLENKEGQKEYRAPKRSFSAEKFVALKRIINNLHLYDQNGETYPLDMEKTIHLILAELMRVKTVRYSNIRNVLGLKEHPEIRFGGLAYEKEKKPENTTMFYEVRGYHAVKKAMVEAVGETMFFNLSQDETLLDDIASVLTFYKTDDEIERELTARFQKVSLESDAKERLVLKLSEIEPFAEFINLSFKALRSILPYMEKGSRYDEACAAAGYDHSRPQSSAEKHRELPVLKEPIRNPVVRRAFAQFRKVINGVIRTYCPDDESRFDRVHIEFARDLKHGIEDRKKIEKGQGTFQKEKEKLRSKMEEVYKPDEITDRLLLKYRLWEEQRYECAYSGHQIEIKQLETEAVQVDHIIPYSRSFDDSLNNKVLCFSDRNQDKKNRTPFEWLGHDPRKWHDFSSWVESSTLKTAKKKRLLKLNFDENSETAWKERNRNDTSHIARLIKEHIDTQLYFPDKKTLGKKENRRRVFVRSGALTSHLRHVWGVGKKSRESHLHHVEDAVILAFATESMVQKLANIAQIKEYFNISVNKLAEKGYDLREVLEKDALRRIGNLKNHQSLQFKQPYKNFVHDLEQRIDDLAENRNGRIVSRSPRRKITGAAHAETIRRKVGDGVASVKTPLSSITPKLLEENRERLSFQLYDLLKQRLDQHGGKPDKAFAEPIYMPLKDGGLGPLIRSVRMTRTHGGGVEVCGGIADNGEMPRVDVFSKMNKRGKNEYFLVPVYVSDFIKDTLPQKAIVANTPRKEWVDIDENFTFLFSLFKDDLIEIKQKNKAPFLGYTGMPDVSTAAIKLASPCGRHEVRIGTKTLESFRKFQVDPLGRYVEVKHEHRLGGIKKP